MHDHMTDPDARSWDDLKRDLEFTPDEHEEIVSGARRLIGSLAGQLDLSGDWDSPHTNAEIATDFGVSS